MKSNSNKNAKSFNILVINPGSTSTKIALFENTSNKFTLNIQHSHEQVIKFDSVVEQLDFRKKIILNKIEEQDINLKSLSCVIGRGGLIRPLPSGTYTVNQKMISDLKDSIKNWGREHPSNLGALIAYDIAEPLNIPSYIADPVVVDEMHNVARISGLNGIERKSIFHALNIRACIRLVAKELKKKMDSLNLIGAHLGGGISIVCYKKGKLIDVNNALLGMGPFSPQRVGALPIGDLVELCFSGESKSNIIKKLSKTGGLYSYLGTDNMPDILNRIQQGDDKAKLIVSAMLYQVVKGIGEYYAVLKGECDGVFLTGGIMCNDYIYNEIVSYLPFIKKIFCYPGENEMIALATGAYEILTGEEKSNTY